MKLSIISDIHDQVWNLRRLLAMPQVEATDALLCCGDICAPFIIRMLGSGYSRPVHIVFGNNDGDIANIIRNAAAFPHIHLHGEYYRAVLGGISVAMNHYPDKARELAQSGTYDLVCHGHDHVLNPGEQLGRTLLLNPGSVMGFNAATLQDTPPSMVVLDTDSMAVEVLWL